MKFRILSSKIQIPELQKDLLIRQHLLENIDQTQEKMLIFHSTAGYGKTVLMCQYIQQFQCLGVWYHLDEMDNHLETFFQYLIAAFRQIWPEFDVDICHNASTSDEKEYYQQVSLELLIGINQYLKHAACLDHKVILVLDNFQKITNRLILTFIQLLVSTTWEELKIFLSIKGNLPNFTTRYLLQEKVKILEMDELAFDKKETITVLEQMLCRHIPMELGNHIYEKIEGWPAGTIFVAQYLRRTQIFQDDINWEVIGRESFLYEYLEKEVYEKLPVDLQHFLTESAVLDEISAHLCKEILCVTDACRMLDDLWQKRVFLVHADREQGTYRYQAIFRMFLLRYVGYKRRVQILQHAFTYYSHHQQISKAMWYCLQSENWAQLLDYVLQFGENLVASGQMAILQSSIMALTTQRTVTLTEEQQKTLGEIQIQMHHETCAWMPLSMEVHFFGTFRVLVGEETKYELSWRTKKTAELFACLAERRGKAVSRNDLLKVLWPDGYPNNAVAMLHNMLYSIRKQLIPFGQHERIQYIHKEYSMQMEGIVCDLYEIQPLCQAVEQKDMETLQANQEYFSQYWGGFLEGIENEWCQAQKYYYERCFLNGCLLLGEDYLEKRLLANAEKFFMTGLEVDPYSETLALGMIRCYADRKEWRTCKKFYEHFCQKYQKELGILPGPQLKHTYEQYRYGSSKSYL